MCVAFFAMRMDAFNFTCTGFKYHWKKYNTELADRCVYYCGFEVKYIANIWDKWGVILVAIAILFQKRNFLIGCHLWMLKCWCFIVTPQWKSNLFRWFYVWIYGWKASKEKSCPRCFSINTKVNSFKESLWSSKLNWFNSCVRFLIYNVLEQDLDWSTE